MRQFSSFMNRYYPARWIVISLIFGLLLNSFDEPATTLAAASDQYLGFMVLNTSGPLSTPYAKACTVICLLLSVAQTLSLLAISGKEFRAIARFKSTTQVNNAIAIGCLAFVFLFFVKTIDSVTLVHALGWLAAPLLVPVFTSILPLTISLVAFRMGYYAES